MFLEPDRTPYDLSFRLFGFPVRVHPLFWLVTLVLGQNAFRDGIEYLLAWVAVVFVSILVHELGHAFAYQAFGVPSHVVLYGMGGLAISYGHLSGRWRRVAVSFAGPAAGFALLGLVWLTNRAYDWTRSSDLAKVVYRSFWWINLTWGLVNLLPVWPLDGGKISRELCEAGSRRNGRRVSLEVSLAVAGLVALFSLLCELKPAEVSRVVPGWLTVGSYFTALMFGLLAFESYQLLQQPDWNEEHWQGR